MKINVKTLKERLAGLSDDITIKVSKNYDTNTYSVKAGDVLILEIHEKSIDEIFADDDEKGIF